MADEQQSERAHKWVIQLFKEQSNQSSEHFQRQLARARNRHMMAWLQRVDDPPQLAQDDVCTRPPPLESTAFRRDSNPTRRTQTVKLVIDEELLDVVDIKTNIPEFKHSMLVSLLGECGWRHLYWSMLVHLAPDGTDVGSASMLLNSISIPRRPKLSFDICHGSVIGRAEGADARYMHCAPFEKSEMFVEFEVEDGARWHGLPMVILVQTLVDGSKTHLIYVKWVSLPISGLDRQMLPLPAHFACHQWSFTEVMGVRRRGVPACSVNFSIMPVTAIRRVVPINWIGTFPSIVNPSMLQAVTKIYRHRAAMYVNPERLRLADLKVRAAGLGISPADIDGNIAQRQPWIDAIRAAEPQMQTEIALWPGAVFAYNVDAYL